MNKKLSSKQLSSYQATDIIQLKCENALRKRRQEISLHKMGLIIFNQRSKLMRKSQRMCPT